MLVIPKDDLIKLISLSKKKTFTSDDFTLLFKEYGDEYYVDSGWEYKLCKENEKRKQLLH